MSHDNQHELDVLAAILSENLGGSRVQTGAELLIPVLQQVQAQLGHVSPGAIRVIADAFNLSRAEVHGVVTFYHDLRTEPVGAHVVQICMAEACQAVGCRALAAHAQQSLGVAMGESTPDGRIHLEAAYCFGNCALGPTVRLGDRIIGGVTADSFDALVADARARDGSDAPARVTVADANTSPGAAGSGVRMYVPNDTGARSVGADAVADALRAAVHAQGLDVEIVRNGTRGAYWMEPLVEIDTPAGRVGFANVAPDQASSLFDDGTLPTASHALSIGLIDALPWLRDQQRLTFARIGVIDPLSLADYRAHGGLQGVERALSLTSQQIVDEITQSGLRGRGGAAFPAGIKWQTVRNAMSHTKYVVCNADEGDSGTFADRLLMECDPFQLIEGMVIAGLAVGATRGYVYIRSEYPHAIQVMQSAVDIARGASLLGTHVMGSHHAFDLEVRVGAGAYICGEETALLESLEGKRGVIRAKPPLPAIAGLFGQPTVINNALTLAAATDILAEGGAAYAARGVGRSKGTMPFQLGGNVNHGGLVEVPFGITLREMVERFGGGTYSTRPMRAIQVGGPLGAYLPESQWDTPLDYESFAAAGAMLGHGGIVVFDDTVDMAEQAEFAMAFCAHESCGKCTPCRIGSTRAVEVISRIRHRDHSRKNWELLEELCETMELGSLCALGGLTPMPVRSVMKHFSADLLAPLETAVS
jgi:formate dehydrogenase iron-sulfur subunit